MFSLINCLTGGGKKILSTFPHNDHDRIFFCFWENVLKEKGWPLHSHIGLVQHCEVHVTELQNMDFAVIFLWLCIENKSIFANSGAINYIVVEQLYLTLQLNLKTGWGWVASISGSTWVAGSLGLF